MLKDKKAEKWLASKKRKAEYWQVKSFLDSLRLKYYEYNKEKDNYSIEVPLFGMRFRFNGIEELEDIGWKLFLISKKKMETHPNYFREDVMWYLVEKGYFLYIHESEHGGNGRIAQKFLIDSGWGKKIIEKRIELCGNRAEHTFMKERMLEYYKLPITRILSLYPGFFGYLL